jgi:hypothetical protein
VEKKTSHGNVRKEVIRALEKVSSCPLKIAVVPAKTRNKKSASTIASGKRLHTCHIWSVLCCWQDRVAIDVKNLQVRDFVLV